MRSIAVLALLALLAAATAEDFGPEANQEQLTHQRDILRLFVRVQQPILFEDLATISKTYQIEPSNFKYPEYAEEFPREFESGYFLARGQPFSVLYEEHLEQLKFLVDLLYSAKDFDTFYKTAVYLRDRINEGQFVYALTISVMLREDTKYIVLPAPYEVFPQLFLSADVIQQAYNARLQGYGSKDKPYYITANYTGFPVAYSAEETVSYFTEDVGLNAFFAYLNYRYPFFLSAANYTMNGGDHRGEIFYYSRRQLLARYYLERLSNYLPDISTIDLYRPIQTGYYPQIRQYGGLEAPLRPDGLMLKNADVVSLERLREFEDRIREAIDLGLAISAKEGRKPYTQKEAINMLGNIIEASEDSIHRRYYGSIYRNFLSIFGHIVDPQHYYGVSPSVLEQFETALRDPAYYQIVKRILSLFEQYQDYLAPYTKQELEFPGLKIESVEVDRLVTYFDNFEIDLGNVLDVPYSKEFKNVHIYARQQRLNHKPFAYHIKLTSAQQGNALVRIFLGPRYDHYGNDMPLDKARHYFVELDRFYYQVQAGANEIVRNSRESVAARPEAPSFRQLYHNVEVALAGQQPFRPAEAKLHQGFPDRLTLPKGTREGMPLRLYVIVTPAQPAGEQPHYGGEWFTEFTDGRALGFPFDRRIPCGYTFDVPNSYFEEVPVYHKTIDEINRASP